MREEIEKIPDVKCTGRDGVIEQMKGKDDIIIEAKVEIRNEIIVDLEGSSER
jgi:N-methylhydantoinase B/oxoprolinase/acetone carboxylase alpha subunit